jgi:indolepyruvate ferredoxin oxidoreductase alpha subunit
VAADALSNLSSPGVTGGVLIVVGEDYGEGASVIQERSHAYALKSGMILLDPRPNLSKMVEMVEHGFQISEHSNMPVMMELRIRACHVKGSFKSKNNIAPKISTLHLQQEPAPFNYSKLAHPPVTFPQEKLKYESRIPAARQYIIENALNEFFPGDQQHIGLIVQGGLYNTLIRTLQQFGLADVFGNSDIPIFVLNVTYPLVPEQFETFCQGKTGVLLLEEGQPNYIEQEVATLLRKQKMMVNLHGKDWLPMGGEYNAEAMTRALLQMCQMYLPHLTLLDEVKQGLERTQDQRQMAQSLIKPMMDALPNRPPSFCVGCPERPVFSALKLAQQTMGSVHIAADIGCHALGTFEPFFSGHTILGYGMSLASRAGVSSFMQQRVLSIMGDGGFWHNGLLTGVQSALFNGDDAVLLIFKNGYTSATGTQDIISTPDNESKISAHDKQMSLAHTNQTIERTLEGLGVKWLKKVHTYEVQKVKDTLIEAFTTDFSGLKVIVAEGECQLERQRRIKPWLQNLLKNGKRVTKVKYGVDEDVCSGDHACIRLSGCPTLTLKDNPDPFKEDPVATVIDGCVGCGLCGENAHAATLCPSFYKAELIQNPSLWEKFLNKIQIIIRQSLHAA